MLLNSLVYTPISERVTPLCVCVRSHLQVPDELSHGDLLRHSMVEAVAVEHHALKDGERALQDGNIHHWLVHVACNLSVVRGEKSADMEITLKQLKLVFLIQSSGIFHIDENT